MSDAYRITDVTSLRGVLVIPRRTKIIVALPSLAIGRSSELERQLNRLAFACGCNTSAASLILVIVACAIVDAMLWSAVQRHPFVSTGANFLACILAIGIGRGVGISCAKWKLVRLVRRVEAQLIENER